ncbi:extracellular solute-binding protein [Yinghuangia sp. ASG 101]|uniref:serine/threonine-protein kinase n=1 Tax=Yinghuangia sp. ASG 101 TaxID=2896848 RepID=UPI001E4B5189|nr:extracellular solute-binding protein [Yinghuangia sp. ASG 101]UGQ10320.1 extracellular solute-binding protein [Yinghuangia sp. ASG 101]
MRPLDKDDPRQIGGYRLVALLGEGTTAQVFLGASNEGRPVVVKAVRDDAVRDTAFRSRFAHEVAAARRVDCPFVVPVLDAETGGSRPWIATAYAPGPALAEAVERHGPLPAETVRTLAAGLAAGLEALHARELTHGRLSPSDVALAPDGPRIVDLGVARGPDGPSIEEGGVVIGTALPSPAFRAPEQLTGGDVGFAADVFSLGAVLVHAARGDGPFGTDTDPGVGDRIVHGTPDLGGLPAWLGQLAVACLAKDPADRPTPGQIRTATAGELDGPGWLPARVGAEVARRAATSWARAGGLPPFVTGASAGGTGGGPRDDRASVPPPRTGGRRRAGDPSATAYASGRPGLAFGAGADAEAAHTGGSGRRRKPSTPPDAHTAAQVPLAASDGAAPDGPATPPRDSGGAGRRRKPAEAEGIARATAADAAPGTPGGPVAVPGATGGTGGHDGAGRRRVPNAADGTARESAAEAAGTTPAVSGRADDSAGPREDVPGTAGSPADAGGATLSGAPGGAGAPGPGPRGEASGARSASDPTPPPDPPSEGAVEQQIVEAELVDDDAPLPPRASADAAPGETDLPGRPATAPAGAAPPPPAGAPGHAPGGPATAPPAPPPSSVRFIRPGPERRRFLAWVAAGGAVLAGAVTGAALWGSGGSDKPARANPAAPPVPPVPSGPSGPSGPKSIRAWVREDTLDAGQLSLLSEELPATLGKSVEYTVERRAESALSQEFVNAFNRRDTIPDVFETDLLSLAAHAAAGRIADLTSYQERFETGSWLPAMRSAVSIDDAVVGVPVTASVPVVLFHRGLYTTAGLPVPRTREEWVDGLEHLRTRFGTNPAFRSLHLPGRAWQVLASFMWETGGEVALHVKDDSRRDGGSWRGGFDLPGSTDAVRFFRQLQQYAPEGADAAESALRPGELFARGETASVIGSAALYSAATAADSRLAGQLDAFPLPGHSPDRPGAVGVGGTALVVSATCRDIPAAVDLLTTLSSARWRSRLAESGRALSPYPADATQGPNPMARAGAAAAAAVGHAYPTAPGWSEKPLVEFGRAVLGGTDAMAAAAASNQIVAAEFGRATG